MTFAKSNSIDGRGAFQSLEVELEVFSVGAYRAGVARVDQVFKEKDRGFVFGAMGGQLA